MQNDLNPERVAQLAEEVLATFGTLKIATEKAKFKQVSDFAKANEISLLEAEFYLVLGALNFPRLDDGRIMFAAITPTHAAKLLNSSQKKTGRLLGNLAEKGLLVRDVNGGYQIADIDVWLELSKSTMQSA